MCEFILSLLNRNFALYGQLIFRCDLSVAEIRKMIEIMVCDLYNSATSITKKAVTWKHAAKFFPLYYIQ